MAAHGASRLLGSPGMMTRWDLPFCLASRPRFTHPRGFWPWLHDPAPLGELRNLERS